MARPYKLPRTANAAHHENSAHLVYVSDRSNNGNFLDLSSLGDKLQELLQKDREETKTQQKPSLPIEEKGNTLLSESTTEQLSEEPLEADLGSGEGEPIASPATPTQEHKKIIGDPTAAILKFVYSTRQKLQFRLQGKEPEQHNSLPTTETKNIGLIGMGPLPGTGHFLPEIHHRSTDIILPSQDAAPTPHKELADLLSGSIQKNNPNLIQSINLTQRHMTSNAPRAKSARMIESLEARDRFPKATNRTLSRLKPLIDDGKLPDIYGNLGLMQKLPAFYERYVRCLIYYLITHPIIKHHHSFPLSQDQHKAFNYTHKILMQHLHPTMLRNFENWIQGAKELLYKHNGNVWKNSWHYKDYKAIRTDKMCHKGYKKLAPSFFKEYIIADILNCTQAHKNKNRKISSDFDDKKLGFDLICVDRDSAEIGVVDMTFNKDEINNKLEKLQRFVESKPSKLNNFATNHDDEYQFDLFDRSEFSYYFFAHSEVRTLKAHTAVLEIHPDKFLCTFMEYIAAINSGKYSHEYIKQKVRTIPGSRKTHRTSSGDNFFSGK